MSILYDDELCFLVDTVDTDISEELTASSNNDNDSGSKHLWNIGATNQKIALFNLIAIGLKSHVLILQASSICHIISV